MHMHQLDALYNSHRSIGHIGFIWGHWGQIMIVIGLPQLQHIKLSKVSCWMGDHIKVFWSSRNRSFVFNQIFVYGTLMGVDYKSEKKI